MFHFHTKKGLKKIFFGVNLCCSKKSSDCCLEKLNNDEIVNCDENSYEAKKSAICLEKFFFNHSLIEENGEFFF